MVNNLLDIKVGDYVSIVKKESNIETNINKEITINTQFGERNIGLFKSNINGDTLNNFIQVNVFDLGEFNNKENKEDISKLYTDFIIETLEKGVEKGLYYMEDLLNIIKNNNKIEFKGNGYDYSED